VSGHVASVVFCASEHINESYMIYKYSSASHSNSKAKETGNDEGWKKEMRYICQNALREYRVFKEIH